MREHFHPWRTKIAAASARGLLLHRCVVTDYVPSGIVMVVPLCTAPEKVAFTSDIFRLASSDIRDTLSQQFYVPRQPKLSRERRRLQK
jgi:hypothetical protein